ncbi:MAG TPA: hypothetical protein VFW75_07785 [Acetobacteraceae bacterium]|nr:hypothetical protein [Acetobacteraceae bacterium]
MRVIFFSLLLVNLLYMAWAEWIDVPPPPQPNPIAALPRLKLASDVPPDKRAAAPAKMALETPAPQCVSVGPFADAAVAAQAADVLKARNFAPQQRAAELPAVRRYWVYLDNLTSDAAVTRVLHRLERTGIDDAEAMPPRAGSRRISLGLFDASERAERRLKAVRSMGLKPEMAERMLPGVVYWLDLTLASNTVAVPLKEVSDLAPSGAGNPVSVQSCPPTTVPAALPASAASAAAGEQAHSAATAGALDKPPLPICKPGGPVPCIVLKAPGQSSVF